MTSDFFRPSAMLNAYADIAQAKRAAERRARHLAIGFVILLCGLVFGLSMWLTPMDRWMPDYYVAPKSRTCHDFDKSPYDYRNCWSGFPS